jgi:pimeloyl-ACP methyl ester carboxylesterase
MGGMIAQAAAIQHPGRVLSLTSISSSTGDRIASVGRPRALAALLKPPPRTREEVATHTVELFRVIGSPGFPLDEQRLRRIALDAYDRSVNPPGFARQMAAILASGSRSRDLRSVAVPSLVIHGAADPLVPPIGGRLTARALPRSRLMMIDGMGHDLPRGAWPRIVDAIAEVADEARAARVARERVGEHGVTGQPRRDAQ